MGRSSAWAVFAVSFALFTLLRFDAAVFADADASTHIRFGLDMVAHGSIPPTDRVLWAEPPFIDPEWLFDLGIAAVWSLGGWTAVALLTNAMAAASLAAVERMLARNVPLWTRLMLLLPLAAALISHLAARPHLVTWLAVLGLIAACGLDAERLAARPGAIGLGICGATALWANTHGGFLIGPVVVGAVLARGALTATQGWWRGAWVPVGMALASLATPYGLELAPHLLAFLRSDVVAHTVDFSRPTPSTVAGVVLIVWTMVAGAAVATRQTSLADLGWIALWLIFGWGAVRNVAIASLCLAVGVGPVFARATSGALREAVESLSAKLVRLQGSAGGRLLTVGLVGVALARALVAPPSLEGFAPVQGIQALPDEGSVFAEQPWGGFLALERPRLRLNAHPLTANHPDEDERLARYFQALQAETGWKDVLLAEDVGWILVAPSAPLAKAARATGWVVVQEDEVSVVLQRP